MKFTDRDLEKAIEDGIFSKYNDTIVPPATVIRYFEKWFNQKTTNKIGNIVHKLVDLKLAAENGDLNDLDVVEDGFNRIIEDIQSLNY